MGVIKGTVSGLGAVGGGVAAIPLGGLPAFIIGAMAGTVVSDISMYLLGNTPKKGRKIGIMKGIAASTGSIAGLFFAGVPSMMAGAFIGSLVGDIIGL
ncbi:hypothetical protein ACOZ32_06010 [Halobacterium sp. MBLA0001]|uniref:hypothetical protein n=1 Tax=Halobacterium sp. MBLA0001 TaxID=3413511 RepID=UPI003C78DC5D